jgi:hypothetical protein
MSNAKGLFLETGKTVTQGKHYDPVIGPFPGSLFWSIGNASTSFLPSLTLLVTSSLLEA